MRDIYLTILIVAATIAAIIFNLPQAAIDAFERAFHFPHPAAVGIWVGVVTAGIGHYIITELWKD